MGDIERAAVEAFFDALEPIMRASAAEETPWMAFKPWRDQREENGERWEQSLAQILPGIQAVLAFRDEAGGGDREAIARIIDSDAWHETLPTDGCGAYWIARRNNAKAKADSILALFAQARS